MGFMSRHRQISLIALTALAAIAAIPQAFAAPNILDQVMMPFKGINFGQFYINNAPFIDGVIYLTLFISIALAVLGRLDAFRENKAAPITIGVILGLAMAVFEYRAHFFLLLDIGPYILLFIAIMLGFMLFRLLRDIGGNVLLSISIAALAICMIFAGANSLGGSGGTQQSPTSQAVNATPVLASIFSTISAFAMLGLIFGIIGQIRSNGDGPSPSERSDLKSFFPRSENAGEGIDGIEKNGILETTDPGEKDLLKTGKEEKKIIEDEDVIPAESAKTSIEVEEEKKKEEARNSNEAQLLNVLENDANTVTKAIAQVNPETASQILPPYIINYVKRVSKIGYALGQNQKFGINARIQLLNQLMDNVNKIKDVTEKSKKIDNTLKKIEKRLPKDLGKSIKDHFREELRAKYSSLKKLQGEFSIQIAQAKKDNNTQQIQLLQNDAKIKIGAIRNNIKILESKQADVIRNIDLFLKQYEAIAAKTVSNIRNVVNKQSSMEKDMQLRINNTYKDVQKYVIYQKNLNSAIEQIGGIVAAIDKEDPKKKMLETSIAESNVAVNGVFLQVSNINQKTISIFQTDIPRILDDFKILELETDALAGAIDTLNKSCINIQIKYEDLRKSAGMDDVKQSNNIKGIMTMINNLSQTSAQERKQVISSTIAQMDKTKSDIQNEIKKMIDENQKLYDKQTRIIKALDNALTTLQKLRIQQMSKIENSAQKLETTIAQGDQQLNQADASIRRVT